MEAIGIRQLAEPKESPPKRDLNSVNRFCRAQACYRQPDTSSQYFIHSMRPNNKNQLVTIVLSTTMYN